jgi:hypothetical protein
MPPLLSWKLYWGELNTVVELTKLYWGEFSTVVELTKPEGKSGVSIYITHGKIQIFQNDREPRLLKMICSQNSLSSSYEYQKFAPSDYHIPTYDSKPFCCGEYTSV